MEISGLSAIITGGSSGLGAATARHLAGIGAKVAILDVNIDLARTVASEIGGIAVECDVSSGEQGDCLLYTSPSPRDRG